MTRIITHQEETHYELAANSESLDFWKTLGFRIKGTGEREDEFYLRKTCSFGIRQQLGEGCEHHIVDLACPCFLALA